MGKTLSRLAEMIGQLEREADVIDKRLTALRGIQQMMTAGAVDEATGEAMLNVVTRKCRDKKRRSDLGSYLNREHKRQLIDDLFTKKGNAWMRFEDIARETGLRATQLYGYFKAAKASYEKRRFEVAEGETRPPGLLFRRYEFRLKESAP